MHKFAVHTLTFPAFTLAVVHERMELAAPNGCNRTAFRKINPYDFALYGIGCTCVTTTDASVHTCMAAL